MKTYKQYFLVAFVTLLVFAGCDTAIETETEDSPVYSDEITYHIGNTYFAYYWT